MTDRYEVTPRNKVRQLRDLGSYDSDAVHGILDAGLYASAAFVQDGQPVVVPMIYGRDGETIYLHGARKARVIRLLEQTGQVCINVTLVDGVVLARSAFNSSMNYRSVTVFGTARLLEDTAAKLHGMRVISEHLMPGRWDELREPLDTEIKMTGVIAVDIESASAKISGGMPDDEDDDYAIPVWAGVVPIETRSKALLDDDRLLAGASPSEAVKALQNRKL
jgi:nitroimidazol reductase NimA-like FMN-containing flavoprotein (pyridoxamine 5'-phosphate oxidase superfamily)